MSKVKYSRFIAQISLFIYNEDKVKAASHYYLFHDLNLLKGLFK